MEKKAYYLAIDGVIGSNDGPDFEDAKQAMDWFHDIFIPWLESQGRGYGGTVCVVDGNHDMVPIPDDYWEPANT